MLVLLLAEYVKDEFHGLGEDVSAHHAGVLKKLRRVVKVQEAYTKFKKWISITCLTRARGAHFK